MESNRIESRFVPITHWWTLTRWRTWQRRWRRKTRSGGPGRSGGAVEVGGSSEVGRGRRRPQQTEQSGRSQSPLRLKATGHGFCFSFRFLFLFLFLRILYLQNADATSESTGKLGEIFLLEQGEGARQELEGEWPRMGQDSVLAFLELRHENRPTLDSV